MAGTDCLYLATCRLKGKPVEELLNSPQCGNDIQKALKVLTREHGWKPSVFKTRADRYECRVSAWHNVHRNITDYCEKFLLPDGQYGFIFSYDWDYHAEETFAYYLIYETDDEILFRGLTPREDGSTIFVFETDADLMKVYQDNKLEERFVPVATAVNGQIQTTGDTILTEQELDYIKKAVKTCIKQDYVRGPLTFEKMIPVPSEENITEAEENPYASETDEDPFGSGLPF